MASLSLAGEEQQSFAILVLRASEVLVADARHIRGGLPGGMGIEFRLNFLRRGFDLCFIGVRFQQVGDAGEMLRRQHLRLREHQPKHRVVWRGVPIDELVHNVLIDAKWQDLRDDADVELLLRCQKLQLRNLVESRRVVGAKRQRLNGRRRIDAKMSIE